MNTKAKGVRVAGTDGSDGKYRMTVENRYKLLAVTRGTLNTVHTMQLVYAALAIVLAVASALHLPGGRLFPFELGVLLFHVVYCVVVFLGKIGAKSNAPGLLWGYILFMSASGVLLVVGAVSVVILYSGGFGWIIALPALAGSGVSLYGAYQAHILHGAVSKK